MQEDCRRLQRALTCRRRTRCECDTGSQLSRKTLLNLFALLGLSEKASIDECFFDFTIPVRDILLKRYPFLAQLPSDAPQGLDTPLPKPDPSVVAGIKWENLGNVIPILKSERIDPTPRDAQVTSDSDEQVASDSSMEPSSSAIPVVEAEHEFTWGDIVRDQATCSQFLCY